MEVQYEIAFQRILRAQQWLEDPWNRQLFGARLKVLRLSKRLHQNTVAAAAGISESKICRIEKGAFRIKPEDAIAVGKALDVSLDKFLYEEAVDVAALAQQIAALPVQTMTELAAAIAAIDAPMADRFGDALLDAVYDATVVEFCPPFFVEPTADLRKWADLDDDIDYDYLPAMAR